MTRAELPDILQRMARQRIAVVGDVMLDRYIKGTARRISPEAPVPVVHVRRQTQTLGGAANVLRNLAALDIGALAFGIIGDDEAGRSLLDHCRTCGIDTAGLVADPRRPTTVKTRVIAEAQQVVRIDEEDPAPIGEVLRDELLARLAQAVDGGGIDGIIVEDYHKGVVDATLLRAVRDLANRHGIVAALDPHPGNPLDVTGLHLLTPNRSEAFALAGAYHLPTVLPLTDDQPLLEVGHRLMARWQPRMLLITLGGDGMALFEAGRDEPFHIPTVAQEVFDVSGAGDTVIATLTGALLAGLSPADAMVVANHAAGVVVGKVGTVPVEPGELLASFAE